MATAAEYVESIILQAASLQPLLDKVPPDMLKEAEKELAEIDSSLSGLVDWMEEMS